MRQVQLKMVTGDAEETAFAVAQKLGIEVGRRGAISGKEIDALSDAVSVFSWCFFFVFFFYVLCLVVSLCVLLVVCVLFFWLFLWFLLFIFLFCVACFCVLMAGLVFLNAPSHFINCVFVSVCSFLFFFVLLLSLYFILHLVLFCVHETLYECFYSQLDQNHKFLYAWWQHTQLRIDDQWHLCFLSDISQS